MDLFLIENQWDTSTGNSMDHRQDEVAAEYKSNDFGDDMPGLVQSAYARESIDYDTVASDRECSTPAQRVPRNERGFEPISNAVRREFRAPQSVTTSFSGAPRALKFQRATPQHAPANDFNYSSVFDDLF